MQVFAIYLVPNKVGVATFICTTRVPGMFALCLCYSPSCVMILRKSTMSVGCPSPSLHLTNLQLALWMHRAIFASCPRPANPSVHFPSNSLLFPLLLHLNIDSLYSFQPLVFCCITTLEEDSRLLPVCSDIKTPQIRNFFSHLLCLSFHLCSCQFSSFPLNLILFFPQEMIIDKVNGQPVPRYLIYDIIKFNVSSSTKECIAALWSIQSPKSLCADTLWCLTGYFFHEDTGNFVGPVNIYISL